MRGYRTATGYELDAIASTYGLYREGFETDMSLRARIQNHIFGKENRPGEDLYYEDEDTPDVPCIGCIILESTISVLMVLFIGFLAYHSWARLMGAPY